MEIVDPLHAPECIGRVGPVVKPTLDTIRSKINTLATI
jgi:hypothetical protein